MRTDLDDNITVFSRAAMYVSFFFNTESNTQIFNYSKCVLVNLRQLYLIFYKVSKQKMDACFLSQLIPLFSPQESVYFKEIVGYMFK